jgi:hypothetical protein
VFTRRFEKFKTLDEDDKDFYARICRDISMQSAEYDEDDPRRLLNAVRVDHFKAGYRDGSRYGETQLLQDERRFMSQLEDKTHNKTCNDEDVMMFPWDLAPDSLISLRDE